MITGFTGMGLNELAGAVARAKQGPPPSRSVQPMPGKDTVHFSVPGNAISASGEQAGVAAQRPVAMERPITIDPPVQPADDMSMLDRMRASFFSSVGDDHFDPMADLNTDGQIDFRDLAVLRNQETPASPKELLARMRGSFFSSTGDENFDPSVDLNTDGIVDFLDLAALRARMDTIVTRPPPAPEPTVPLEPSVSIAAVEANPATGKPRFDVQPGTDTPSILDAIRTSFFVSEGHKSYNTAAHINGDGRVNFADLAVLRSR